MNTETLRTWQTLWMKLAYPAFCALQHRNRKVPWRWPTSAVKRLTGTAHTQLEHARQELDSLLIKSRTKLAPFGEPLELGLGVHRWFSHQREEAYSDWLEWILGKMTACEIAKFFDVPELLQLSHERPTKTHRELWVKAGHDNASGRLDLLIEFPESISLVIELKTGDAAGADTQKQEGYFESMERWGANCHYRLLVTDAPSQAVHRFTVIRYATLCVRMRQWVVDAPRDDPRSHSFFALILAFVGAIESNLLNLRITPGLPSPAVLLHLSTFLGATMNNEQNEETLFLKEGFASYLDVVSAVHLFQTKVGDILKMVLDGDRQRSKIQTAMKLDDLPGSAVLATYPRFPDEKWDFHECDIGARVWLRNPIHSMLYLGASFDSTSKCPENTTICCAIESNAKYKADKWLKKLADHEDKFKDEWEGPVVGLRRTLKSPETLRDELQTLVDDFLGCLEQSDPSAGSS